MEDKDIKMFFSTTEVAKILNTSRITIFNKIKQGLIRAEKIGKNWKIPREEITHILDKKNLSEKEKSEISNAVEKAVKEYGQAIRMLGKE